MGVLVDTSVWIEYFRSGENSKDLDKLIDENLVVTNEVILAELVPFLKLKRQYKVIGLLQELLKSTLNVNWSEIIEFQTNCLKCGANGIGLPDLMIAQNAMQNELEIFSLDKHFKFLHEIMDVQLYTKNG